MVQECEAVSLKWFRIVSSPAGSVKGVSWGKPEVGQNCEVISRKWGRSVRGSARSGSVV